MKGTEQYDYQKKNQAILHVTLRGAVSVYLLTLAAQILRGVGEGNTSMPVWTGRLIAAVFAAAAVGFGVYAWKRLRRDLKAARLSDENPR